MNFNRAFEFIMKWEGGSTFTNDENDPGGMTRYGISQRAYPDLDIYDLSESQAREIYRRDYWIASMADWLPEPIRLAHFDAAVNTGVKRANKLLQKALRVKPDGIVGAKTIAAANRKGASVLPDMLAYRALFYISIVRRNPSQSKFMFGWLRRTFSIANQQG